MWYFPAWSQKQVISSGGISRNVSIQSLLKTFGKEGYWSSLYNWLIPQVFSLFFSFFYYCDWCQLVTAQGLLLVCHRPVMSCNVPKCLTQPLPKAVRGKSTTSFSTKKYHCCLVYFQLLTVVLSFHHNWNWYWLILQEHYGPSLFRQPPKM